jgi:RHS repeat-associated protein
LLNDGVNQYLYDGDGRICAVASTPVAGMTVMTGYLYDAGGTRVAKGTIAAWSCDPATSGFQATNDYVLGSGGEQVTEMGIDTSSGGSNSIAWQHTNVWAGGRLMATYDNDGLHFYLDDPLGTRRVQTDYAGVVEQSCASLPFGDGESCAPTPTEHLFTGKERDTESGNDYFGARYYASTMGRFMSPDPIFAEANRVLDPQQWNMYAYARNNPLSITDPTGMDFNLGCSGSSLTCQGGKQGMYQFDKDGNLNFEAAKVSNDASGGGFHDQFGGTYSGTFSVQGGVSFTDSNGNTSNHSQFIQGSNETDVHGSGAYDGLTGHFRSACGGSCQAEGWLTGSSAAFDKMEHSPELHLQSGTKSFLDALSLAHPFGTTQWKDSAGYDHLISKPGYRLDMHFEGAATGSGSAQFGLHALGTIKDMFNGAALEQRGSLVPGQDGH